MKEAGFYCFGPLQRLILKGDLINNWHTGDGILSLNLSLTQITGGEGQAMIFLQEMREEKCGIN